MRADFYLSSHGYVSSRTRATSLISEGLVFIDGVKVAKCSEEVDETVPHDVQVRDSCPYVSRGGLKLEGALEHFHVDVTGMKALDVGASTGGFTDCLLQHGASKVCALDNGRGQLAQKLVSDSRVTSLEEINARYLTPGQIPFLPDLIVMDVSFISQTLLLPVLAGLCREGTLLISLIKPQFEAGRSQIGKGGIVKSKKAALDAVDRVVLCAGSCGFSVHGTTESPIPGKDGNTEYLMYASFSGTPGSAQS